MMRDDQRRNFTSVMGSNPRASMCFINSRCSKYESQKNALKLVMWRLFFPCSCYKNVFFVAFIINMDEKKLFMPLKDMMQLNNRVTELVE